MNGSRVILECLIKEGVDTVFGYPGGAVIPLYDALYDYMDKIKHSTFHENGTFEYTSDTSAKSKHIQTCHMSDLLMKKEK